MPACRMPAWAGQGGASTGSLADLWLLKWQRCIIMAWADLPPLPLACVPAGGSRPGCVQVSASALLSAAEAAQVSAAFEELVQRLSQDSAPQGDGGGAPPTILGHFGSKAVLVDGQRRSTTAMDVSGSSHVMPQVQWVRWVGGEEGGCRQVVCEECNSPQLPALHLAPTLPCLPALHPRVVHRHAANSHACSNSCCTRACPPAHLRCRSAPCARWR